MWSDRKRSDEIILHDRHLCCSMVNDHASKSRGKVDCGRRGEIIEDRSFGRVVRFDDINVVVRWNGDLALGEIETSLWGKEPVLNLNDLRDSERGPWIYWSRW